MALPTSCWTATPCLGGARQRGSRLRGPFSDTWYGTKTHACIAISAEEAPLGWTPIVVEAGPCAGMAEAFAFALVARLHTTTMLGDDGCGCDNRRSGSPLQCHPQPGRSRGHSLGRLSALWRRPRSRAEGGAVGARGAQQQRVLGEHLDAAPAACLARPLGRALLPRLAILAGGRTGGGGALAAARGALHRHAAREAALGPAADPRAYLAHGRQVWGSTRRRV
mmetsp:Transcript_138756/g.431643  ORF Transcript_138756/g.431643 Transcript_138756/m.431643 type:complete len:223 (+) Transcript_138756:373-1041(+)